MMKHRLLTLIPVLAAVATLSAAPVLADNTYTTNSGETITVPVVSDNSFGVYDFGNLLSDSEESELEAQITKIEKSKNIDVIILTTDNIPVDAYYSTETTMKFIEQFYLDNGFANDCLGYCIDMSNRVMYCMGHGKYGTEEYLYFTGEDGTVINDTYEYMRNQDYFGALKVFLKDVNKLDNVAFAAIPTLGSLIASAVMSALTVLGLVGKHSKTQPSKHATPAVKAIDYRTNRHNKRFGGRFVNRRVIPRHDNISHGGGGGGGGIHTGGGFSGGGGSFSGGGTHF